MTSKANPQVFFDISVGKTPLGRVTMELFADMVPKTAENFRCLCTGERGTSPSGHKLHYKGSTFHRIISGFMAQGGDFTAGDGTGGESIYGTKFNDESFYYKHTSAGLLSMANSGPHTNGSQFFITFRDTGHLDGRHVVFGKVISGMEVVKELEHVATINDRPKQAVVISDCGQIVATNASVAPAESVETVAEPDEVTEEVEEPEEEIDEVAYNNMSEMEKRLFNIRLKINKGRKANKAAAVDEYKRFTDPKYAKKQQLSEPRDDKPKSTEPAYMFDTAEKSEYLQEKQRKKESNKATFGWQAFTTDAQYKSYKKQLNKLPTSSAVAPPTDTTVPEFNELQYGKKGTEVSNHGLNRLVTSIEERERQRETFSRRRAHIDATSVDAINSKNEHFNKKLKRTYDKYTVEIRQNLERGTAL